MSNSKRGKAQQELLDDFESTFFEVKEKVTHIEMTLERRRRDISFKVPRVAAAGFDVGATVEEYGIYPWAGRWQGMPWEPIRNQWQIRDVCVMFFGFVRILLSPTARLRCTHRRDKLRSVNVELRDKSKGWTTFERLRFFVLPFGRVSESFLHNEHLPPRELKADGEFSPW